MHLTNIYCIIANKKGDLHTGLPMVQDIGGWDLRIMFLDSKIDS